MQIAMPTSPTNRPFQTTRKFKKLFKMSFAATTRACSSTNGLAHGIRRVISSKALGPTPFNSLISSNDLDLSISKENTPAAAKALTVLVDKPVDTKSLSLAVWLLLANSAAGVLISIRHPVNLAAKRTFCPSLPIAKDCWSSGTKTLADRSDWLKMTSKT